MLVEDTITIAPEIKKFMDETKMMQQQSNKKNNAMLSGSILSAAVFLGSAFIFESNETAVILGCFWGVFVSAPWSTVTLCPAVAAASATAHPKVPDDQFERYRTGSMGSIVAPIVRRMCNDV